MRCDDCREALNGYVDHELMPEETDEVRKHLAGCGTCDAEHDVTLALSRRIRSGLERTPAPDVLKARIRSALVQGVLGSEVPAAVGRARWGRLLAAGVTIALLSGGTAFAFARRGNSSTAVAEQVLSSHIRALMPGHLTDVASTDLHNVKPWFNGRLDLSPEVPRLDAAGFPLVGGRLDYVAGRFVAAIVYMRRQHIINVFSWPVERGATHKPRVSTERGYHLVEWNDGSSEFWAASDLSVPELELFVSLFVHDGAPPPPPGEMTRRLDQE